MSIWSWSCVLMPNVVQAPHVILQTNDLRMFFEDLLTVKLHIKLAKTITHPQPPSGGPVFVVIFSSFSQFVFFKIIDKCTV